METIYLTVHIPVHPQESQTTKRTYQGRHVRRKPRSSAFLQHCLFAAFLFVILTAIITLRIQAPADEPAKNAVRTDTVALSVHTNTDSGTFSKNYIEPQDSFPPASDTTESISDITEPVDAPVLLQISDFVTDAEIIKIAKTVYGEAWVTQSDTEMSAVIWCILNRYDAHHRGAQSVDEVIVWSQFNGYDADNPVNEHILALTHDVLQRWIDEKNGVTDSGRTLPKDYIYFTGDGLHNYFTKTWPDGPVYDWSLGTPYDT